MTLEKNIFMQAPFGKVFNKTIEWGFCLDKPITWGVRMNMCNRLAWPFSRRSLMLILQVRKKASDLSRIYLIGPLWLRGPDWASRITSHAN